MGFTLRLNQKLHVKWTMSAADETLKGAMSVFVLAMGICSGWKHVIPQIGQ